MKSITLHGLWAYEDTDYMGGWVMTLHITRGEALSYYKGKYF